MTFPGKIKKRTVSLVPVTVHGMYESMNGENWYKIENIQIKGSQSSKAILKLFILVIVSF